MKKFLVTTALISASLAFTGVISTSTAAAAPLTVKIATFDGKKKIKVARKLKAVASCSKDCGIRITFALRTPAGTVKDTVSGKVPGNRLIPVNSRLNNAALRYLKNSYRSSRYTINVSAVDLENGKRVVKKKSFRFYR